MSEKTKKLLIALIPGEVCCLAALVMVFRSDGKTDSLEFYIALGALGLGTLITTFNLIAWNKIKE